MQSSIMNRARLLRVIACAVSLGALLVVWVPARMQTVALSAQGSAQPAAAARAVVLAAAHLPIGFEPNRGQALPQVQFLAHSGSALWTLTPTGLTVTLNAAHRPTGQRAAASSSASVRFQLLGAASHVNGQGQQTLPGTVTYLRGANPRQWLVGLPTYAQVAYHAIYPGTSLLYDGSQGQIEYRFVIAAGAPLPPIQWAVVGVRSIRQSDAGGLTLALPDAGSVLEQPPHAYQTIDGQRRTVAIRYTVRGQRVGFRVGTYNRHLPLVIDPVVSYATYLGGSGNEQGVGVAVGSDGSTYITGFTSSPGTGSNAFPTTNGAYAGTQGGDYNAFVTKLSPDGSSLLYSTYLGGSGDDEATSIAVDGAGDAYVAGFAQAGFPTTTNAFQGTFGGGAYDAFVSELNPTGTALLYSSYLGGSGDDYANGVAVTTSGQVYLVGSTTGGIPTLNAYQSAPGGGYVGNSDAFVAHLNTAQSGATSLLYATYLGGSGDDYGNGIAVDGSGAAYVVGDTTGGFPTQNAYQSTFGGGAAGNHDAFVTKLDPSGQMVFSTYLGGSGDDYGNGIAVGADGTASIVGYTSGGFPTLNANQGTFGGGSAGNHDAFVAQLGPSGQLVYATYLGGSGDDYGNGIAVDGSGAAYVVGDTTGGFPTQNAYQSTFGGGAAGNHDAFVTKLDPSGQMVYATYLGGSGDDYGSGIAIDANDNATITGQASASFPTTTSAYQTAFGGGTCLLSGATTPCYDAFIARLLAVPVVTGIAPSSGSSAGGTLVTITGTGLAGAAGVSFGGVTARVISDTATSVTVVSPFHGVPATVDVSVTTAGGTSPVGPLDQFVYVDPALQTPPGTPTAGGPSAPTTPTATQGSAPVSPSATPVAGPAMISPAPPTVSTPTFSTTPIATPVTHPADVQVTPTATAVHAYKVSPAAPTATALPHPQQSIVGQVILPATGGAIMVALHWGSGQPIALRLSVPAGLAIDAHGHPLAVMVRLEAATLGIRLAGHATRSTPLVRITLLTTYGQPIIAWQHPVRVQFFYAAPDSTHARTVTLLRLPNALIMLLTQIDSSGRVIGATISHSAALGVAAPVLTQAQIWTMNLLLYGGGGRPVYR